MSATPTTCLARNIIRAWLSGVGPPQERRASTGMDVLGMVGGMGGGMGGMGGGGGGGSSPSLPMGEATFGGGASGGGYYPTSGWSMPGANPEGGPLNYYNSYMGYTPNMGAGGYSPYAAMGSTQSQPSGWDNINLSY